MTDLLTVSDATISACSRYRYRLSRTWDAGKPPLVFVMLNPSTADANKDDATITRCSNRARNNGFGSLAVVNLFAWRSTDPRELFHVGRDPIGPENDAHIAAVCGADGAMIVAAWGNHGTFDRRDQAVIGLICRDLGKPLHALKVTGQGTPGHPLYIPMSQTPFVWKPAA
jgi:hypothetical protein